MKARFIIIAVSALILASCSKYAPVKYDKAWMGSLPDAERVCRLAIPGAHDAATGTLKTPIVRNFAKTQALTMEELWDAGVRAFDLRPAYVGKELMICHDKYSTGTTMAEALGTIAAKLDAQPSECAIVIIRHESEADDDSANWGPALLDCIKALPSERVQTWFDPAMRLGDLRGKILILSRQEYASEPYGAYISGWYSGGELERQKAAAVGDATLWIQDFYDPESTEEKWGYFEALAKDFAECEEDVWCINHCSGYRPATFGLPNYEANASGVNLKASENPSLLRGIIMMDFAGTDFYNNHRVHGATLVSKIISANNL